MCKALACVRVCVYCQYIYWRYASLRVATRRYATPLAALAAWSLRTRSR